MAIPVKEAGRSPPPFPFIFFKPTPCITDHGADVIIPKICQDDQADYEGELVCHLSKFNNPKSVSNSPIVHRDCP